VDAMKAAYLSGNKEEINIGKTGAKGADPRRKNHLRGSVGLPIKAALGVRGELEPFDQGPGPVNHVGIGGHRIN